MSEVTKQAKIAIIENEIAMYNNTSYQMSLRARAARITENKQQEEAATKEVEYIERTIDWLKKELAEVKKSK